MKSRHLQHLLVINFAMLCISTSGALGRYINLPPPLTIWYRAFLALLFLAIYCLARKISFRFDFRRHGFIIFLAGLLMALHWVTYFYALKWSNIAIGMLTLFTYPVMTALLEPLFFKIKFQPIHLLLGVIILVGVYLLAPTFDPKDGMTQGLLIGLFSALCYAVRNLILKKKIDQFDGSMLMFYQMVITILVLLPAFFYYDNTNITPQLPYLIFLGLVTTAIGHTIFLNSFRNFSISTISIMSSIQPIFGIIIGIVFLHEIPEFRSVIGGSLILLTVLIESYRSKAN